MFVKQGPNTTDAALSVSTSFAVAGTPAVSNALDLGQAQNVTPGFELEVNVPALPNLAAGQSVSLKVQDSADGQNFADVVTLPATGGAVGGSAALARRVGLASTTRQYVQLVATESAGGGDLTGAKFEFHPVFWHI